MANVTSIDVLKAKLNKLSKDSFIKRTKNVLTKEQVDLVTAAGNIIGQCRDGSWMSKDYVQLQLDVLALQSILISFAIEFGDIMSLQEADNNSISAARAKIRMDARKAKQELLEEGTIVKCTLDDVKDIAYEYTADAMDEYDSHKLVGDHMKFIYYAVRDQVQLMEKALTRIARNENHPYPGKGNIPPSNGIPSRS